MQIDQARHAGRGRYRRGIDGLDTHGLGGWEPNERYPDPAIKIIDPSFGKYRIAQTTVERIAAGCRWTEGPVYFGDGRYLLWSDIPNNRIMRWDEETGRTSVFRKPSNFANGHTRDRQGRLVTCEHDTRRVTRTEYDGTHHGAGSTSSMASALNSPNDVVVKSDNSIWFTDPPFGIARQLRRSASRRRNCRPTSIAIDKTGQADASSRARSTGRTGWHSRPTRRSSMWSRRR